MSPRVVRNRRRLQLLAAVVLFTLAGVAVLNAISSDGGGIPDSVYLVAFMGCLLTGALYADVSGARRLRRARQLHRVLEARHLRNMREQARHGN